MNLNTSIADPYRKLRADLDAHVAAVHEQIKVEARRVIEHVGVEFFKANPSVTAIRWTQYTPYWSDGDACVFRANSPDLQIFESEAERDSDDEDGDDEENSRYFEGQQNFLKNRGHRLRSISEIKAEMAAPPSEDAASDRRRAPHRRPRGQVQLDRELAEVAEIEAKIRKAGGEEAYSRIVADFDAACSVIKAVRNSDLEIAFGDHAQVFLTRNGLRAEKFDHD